MSFGQWKPTITLKYQPFPKQACIHKIINEPIDSNPQDDIYNLEKHGCYRNNHGCFQRIRSLKKGT